MHRRTFLKAFVTAAGGIAIATIEMPGVALIKPVEKELVKRAFDPGYLNELNLLTQRMWSSLKSDNALHDYTESADMLYEWLLWKEGRSPEPKWRVVAMSTKVDMNRVVGVEDQYKRNYRSLESKRLKPGEMR